MLQEKINLENITDKIIEDNYYKIVELFGRIEYVGCYNLAVAVTLYNATYKQLKDLYEDVASVCGSTFTAVERNIRVYLEVILEDKTIDDISGLINYPLNKTRTSLHAKEFIAALKLHLVRSNAEVE